jgi:TonB family protein
MHEIEALLLQLQLSGRVRENTRASQLPLQMEETTGQEVSRLNASAGHLSIHLENEHPVEVPFNFDWQPRRTGWSMAVSFGINIVLLAAALLLPTFFPPRTIVSAFLPDTPNEHIVWLSEPGPGGGGGGGGNKTKEPPRVAQLPGKEKITVPVEKPPAPTPKPPEKEPELVAQLNIPAVTLGSSVESLPGVIASQPGLPTASQGSGSGGGAGTGTGTGIGPGSGSGLGPGTGGGTGGGAYRPGNGVTTPELLQEVKPAYTAEAMRAKVQGSVYLECVVRQDGSTGDCRVVRSLDPTFGLDQEAIRAARQWRFRPGTRLGQPVPVLVTIELMFTLR